MHHMSRLLKWLLAILAFLMTFAFGLELGLYLTYGSVFFAPFTLPQPPIDLISQLSWDLLTYPVLVLATILLLIDACTGWIRRSIGPTSTSDGGARTWDLINSVWWLFAWLLGTSWI